MGDDAFERSLKASDHTRGDILPPGAEVFVPAARAAAIGAVLAHQRALIGELRAQVAENRAAIDRTAAVVRDIDVVRVTMAAAAAGDSGSFPVVPFTPPPRRRRRRPAGWRVITGGLAVLVTACGAAPTADAIADAAAAHHVHRITAHCRPDRCRRGRSAAQQA